MSPPTLPGCGCGICGEVRYATGACGVRYRPDDQRPAEAAPLSWLDGDIRPACVQCKKVGDWPGDFCSDACLEGWHTARLPVRVAVLDSATMWHNAPNGPRTPAEKADAQMEGPWPPERAA